MSSSRPKPFQTLATLAARPFRLAAPLHACLRESETFQTAASGGRGRNVADRLNRRRANILILRAERRTRVHCASPDLDARRKGEDTILCAARGSAPSGFTRRKRRC
jgi:hypothetical protein